MTLPFWFIVPPAVLLAAFTAEAARRLCRDNHLLILFPAFLVGWLCVTWFAFGVFIRWDEGRPLRDEPPTVIRQPEEAAARHP